MSERIQVPKGTYDVLGDGALARDQLVETAKRLFEAAGYSRIETPVYESTDLFRRGVGGSTDIVQKEMFTFEDAGQRSLTLRPEGTAPVVRSYLEHGMHKLPQPVKLWYFGPFFRAEQPQKGRFRQFWQIGAEAIGSDDPAVDAELIVLLAELLEAVGARGVSLQIGSLGSIETRADYLEQLKGFLRSRADELNDEVRGRIDLNPLRAFDASDPRVREVMRDAPRLLDHLSDDDRAHFDAVKALLDATGVTYTVDTALVRGIDYYTRTLFEFSSTALGAQSGVGGGGRYDGLAEQLGGKPTPGVGWAAGVERMLLAGEQAAVGPVPVDLYVSADEERAVAAFRLVDDARRAGHAAQLELAGRSEKGVFKQADRIGARYVAVLGADGARLRDMESGQTQTIDPANVMHFIRGGQL